VYVVIILISVADISIVISFYVMSHVSCHLVMSHLANKLFDFGRFLLRHSLCGQLVLYLLVFITTTGF